MYILIEVHDREISTPTVHKTLKKARETMLDYVRTVLDADEDADIKDLQNLIADYEGSLTKDEAYCTRHGVNWDWSIFPINPNKEDG